MHAIDIDELEKIVKEDGRYKKEAFLFVYRVLQHTLERLEVKRHISARELLRGISQYGKALYGPMTKTVLEHWGITKTQDFGEIFFLMANARLGRIRRSPRDSLEDFKDVYDFEDEFNWREDYEKET